MLHRLVRPLHPHPLALPVTTARQNWKSSPVAVGTRVPRGHGSGLSSAALVVECPACGAKGVQKMRRQGAVIHIVGVIVHVVEIKAPNPNAQTYEQTIVECCREPDEKAPGTPVPCVMTMADTAPWEKS